MAPTSMLETRGIEALPLAPVATLPLAEPIIASFRGVVVPGGAIGPIAVAGKIRVLAGRS